MKRLISSLFILSFISTYSQSSSEIYTDIQKLASLKKVLYVAAHPDDENTRALAWFSLSEYAETAYFSLTRGDGGQNLIGNELGSQLGILRTQELLAARRHDKSNQYFSRAVDFGYSKTAKESFEKWGKDELLSDLVLMIRKFKPDIIITRFPPDKRAGHGHHTASAMLALEAFDLAAKKNYLPQQVKKYGTWQVGSVYWNSSTWWDKSLAEKATNNPDYIVKDIGRYNSLLGMSYNEIGTIARSQHKCQGFGAIIERGSRVEYFKYMKGKKLDHDFFENNKEEWKSLISSEFETQINALLNNYDFKTPSNNVQALLTILSQLESLPDSFFKEYKIKQCKEIIEKCLGLHLELLADDYAFAKGDSIPTRLEVISRSSNSIKVKEITYNNGKKIELDANLISNKPYEKDFVINNNYDYSTPYWLKRQNKNLFTVEDENNLLQAESKATVQAKVMLEVNGMLIPYTLDLNYKWRDPSYGERIRPVIITPKMTLNFEKEILISSIGESKKINFTVHNYGDKHTSKIQSIRSRDVKLSQIEFEVSFDKKHQEKTFTLEIEFNKEAKKSNIHFKSSSGEILHSIQEITYDHIPTQTTIKKEVLELVPINVKIEKGKIAYIKGVKDAVPEAIRQLGFEVDEIEVSQLSDVNLSQYQSVVLGIRVYNVHKELMNYNPKLYEYVENGGNLIMQYNTAYRFGTTTASGPKPFKISRNRVTEEDSEVTFLAPEHPILNYPNKITKEDFDNWVQERGLYFASDWDKSYTPLLSWADDGEEAQKGSLIVLKHGKGQFVYTGISFFRELPKGVEGAYRLFANLLSYQHE